MKIVGKLSVKTVVGKVPTQTVEVPKIDNGQVVTDASGNTVTEKVQRGIKQNLLRVFGQCDRLKVVQTAYGESTGFLGNFEGINALNGEVYRSSALYLPPVVEDIVRAQVLAAQDGVLNSKDAGVQFAFDIGADSANTAHGYQYTITPLVETSKSDPLEAMRQTLLGNVAPLQIANAKQPELIDNATSNTSETEATKISKKK